MTIGPLALQTEFAIVAMAMLVAWVIGFLAGKAQHVGIGEVLTDMLLVALFASRIAFVAQWFDKYEAQAWSMLDIRDGGFTAWVGWLAAAVFACWRFWRTPGLRKPLAWGLAGGALVWGALTMAYATDASGTKPLPHLHLQTIDGASTSLAKLAEGKPAVINLWATWCPPCRREMPVLAQAQVLETDIAFVFVNQGEDAAKIQAYLRTSSLQLNHVLLDPGNTVAKTMGSSALPTTFFFNAQGNLVATHTGALSEASLAAKLAQIRK
jgi:thiol-disulfide isomerase/thioredoxin